MSTLTERWFSKSNDVPSGMSQNERFADRLNGVWFKYNTTSRSRPDRKVTAFSRLGKFLTDLLNKVNDLIERVEKLEGKSAIQTSSLRRTAVGSATIERMNDNWRFPTRHFPDTVLEAVTNIINSVASGEAGTSVIRRGGLKITVEKR